MELIAVVLKSPTSTQRFESAKALLNFGFSNYTLKDVYPDQALPPIPVLLGEAETVQPVLSRTGRLLVEADQAANVTTEISLCTDVAAPVEQGQVLGQMIVRVGDEVRETIPLVAEAPVARLSFPSIFARLWGCLTARG